jgi:hypothetical protein
MMAFSVNRRPVAIIENVLPKLSQSLLLPGVPQPT